MRHLSLEAGRRRRGRLLATWIAIVIFGYVAFLKLSPEVPHGVGAMMLLLVVAAIAYPSWWTRRRNAEVEACTCAGGASPVATTCGLARTAAPNAAVRAGP